MTNYLEIGRALMKHLPLLDNSTQTIKLGQNAINTLSKKNPELGKILTGLTEGIAEPTIEIAQKAKANYAIAGFKVHSGNKLLTKGAYSSSKGSNGIVEKAHVEANGVLTKIASENGKTKMDFVDYDILPNALDDISTTLPKLTHQKRVNSFFNRQADVIKGLDSKNLWIKQDLSNLTPAQLDYLEEALALAAKKGIKIPYGKEFEYIEVPLTMTDGRKHFVKMFPHFYDGKVNMRMYMDNDIPKDIHKTYRNVSLDAGEKQHPGVAFKLGIENLPRETQELLNKWFSSEDANSRLKARLFLAELIDDNWTQNCAKEFIEDYELATRSFLKRRGIINSPLKPSFY